MHGAECPQHKTQFRGERRKKSRSYSLARSGVIPCSFRERSLPSTMKVIPLTEAKANLSHYARRCHDEPIIVTVNGMPAFQLVPLTEEDDLIDRLIEYNPKFRKLLEKRLKERTISMSEARKRI